VAFILVTGASAGLGLATVNALLEAGHGVVPHVRNRDRLAGIRFSAPTPNVAFGDLADRDGTVRLATQLNDLGRFDAVIHNAGVLNGPDVLAVNVVAPYLLTALMMPPGRTVILSSSMHLAGTANLDHVDFDRTGQRGRTYEDSKLYATALVMAGARLWPDSMFSAVDPGWVPTRMGGSGAPDSLDEGHRTQEWLATADPAGITPRSGAYWYHGRTRRAHPAAYDQEFQDSLLRKLERSTGIPFPAQNADA
jgi:NAD(P)-dependent dehydrogenase (short-subunit alcohol dehydrogenase family)